MLSRLSISVCALVLTACATNPVTNRSQLSLIDEVTVISESYATYAASMSNAQGQGQLNTDATQVKRIRDIAYRIVPHAVSFKPAIINWQWDVNLVKNDEANAYCMAGGKIAVYTGLIEQIDPTDDELAQVIAHEIAHALSGHSQEKMSMAIVGDLVGSAVVLTTAGYGTTINADGVRSLVQLTLTLPNSRQAETEADAIGIKLAAAAGFNPQAAATLWRKMSAANAQRPLTLLSTHPDPDNRVMAMTEEATKLEPLYQAGLRRAQQGTQPKIEYQNGKPTGLYGKAVYKD